MERLREAHEVLDRERGAPIVDDGPSYRQHVAEQRAKAKTNKNEKNEKG